MVMREGQHRHPRYPEKGEYGKWCASHRLFSHRERILPYVVRKVKRSPTSQRRANYLVCFIHSERTNAFAERTKFV